MSAATRRGGTGGTTLPYRLVACRAAVAALLIFASGVQPRISEAHWVDPAAIVAGLAGDASLRESAGVRRVERRELLLVIAVDRARWEDVAEARRLQLADEWRQTWRHNVPGGVVAVVDSSDEAPLINYDGRGKARILRH